MLVHGRRGKLVVWGVGLRVTELGRASRSGLCLCMDVFVYVCMYVYMYVCIGLNIDLPLSGCLSLCVCLCVCLCVRLCVCVLCM